MTFRPVVSGRVFHTVDCTENSFFEDTDSSGWPRGFKNGRVLDLDAGDAFPVDDLRSSRTSECVPRHKKRSRPNSKQKRSGFDWVCPILSDFQLFLSEVIDHRAYFGDDSPE